MSNINTVALSGNLTRDPELRLTSGGTTVANLGMAVNRSRKGDDGEFVDEVSYFDLTAFGNFADLIGRKLRKGDSITVQGRLEQQRWEAEDGSKRSKVVVIVATIDSDGFFRSKDEDADTSAAAEGGEAAESKPKPDPKSDDIPF